MTDSLDTLLPGYQITQRSTSRPNPLSNRHCETALPLECARAGRQLFQVLPQQPLAHAPAHFQTVGQAERHLCNHGVEEGRAALQSMRHEAAIQLGQEILRQPVGAIQSLRHLQARAIAN